MSKILKGLNEVNPHNYDSDWDYQDAVASSGRSRSSYRSQEDDTSDADIAYSKKMYQLSQKQKRDADHDRLASGTNEGTGLDIDRTIPGRTIARISGDIKHRTGSPSGKKLPDYHPDDDYDQWSGKVDPSIHDDEEDTFDTDYTGDEEGELKEISNFKLGKYKTAAAADAGKADIEGDYKRADKRFSGIVKATKKQFANDTKTVKEDINSIYSEAKSLLTKLDENMQQKVINALQKKVDDEQPAEPFKTGYPRVKNPQILGTQNRAKSIYHPPSKPNVKKLDKPLPESLGDELTSKSIQALQQVKQQLEQQRMAELEQWEKDFKQNTVSKFVAREPNLRQRATSTSMVAMPGEKHSDLKTRLGQLNKAIEKQGILDKLVEKLDKKGLLTPNIEAGVDTSMLARDGARDNYVELNKKLDKALEYVKNRLLTNKAAYAKPKAIDEEQLDELSCWSGYHRVAGTKAGFPGSCKKNKTNEEEIDEINRRGFLKGMGAAAVAGAAGSSKADWEKEPDITDPMTDEVIKKWKNISNDGSATLKFLHSPASHPSMSRQLSLFKNNGMWSQPQGSSGSVSGRIRTDNNPPIYVRFVWTVNERGRVISNPVQVTAGGNNPFGDDYQELVNSVLNAKQRILLDTSGIGGGILEFRPNVKESVNQGLSEEQHSCPHCGGEMVSEELMNEKKDACYYKVKSRYKVWPSAYASGALVKCRKKGASNWGTGGKKNESSILEGIERADESLHDWFNKEKWVRMDTKGNIKGPCAREPGEGKPKCLPQSKAHSLGKKGRASAAQRKRREDPNPERSGKAINVDTKKSKG